MFLSRLFFASALTGSSTLPYKSWDSVLLGKPVGIRRGPATVSGEERSRLATGAKALGRQLRSDELQARRPTEFTPIRIDLEGRSLAISEVT
jgi:hypothetical protein